VNRYHNLSWPESVAHCWQRTKFGKGTGIVIPAYIESQKAWARELLLRMNPYTDMTWAEDPALVTLEISNEDSLVTEWLRGSLDGPCANQSTGYASIRDYWKIVFDTAGNGKGARGVDPARPPV